jgi:hypothetical protein
VEDKVMKALLVVEFFDTDASSYTHRLRLPLKHAGSFRVSQNNILDIEHEDGTTRSVPLLNVKQYYEVVQPLDSDTDSNVQQH